MEEHIMEFDCEDLVILETKSGCAFSRESHYPPIAGHTGAGEPYYISEGPELKSIAHLDAVQPEHTVINQHNAHGSAGLSRLSRDVRIYALRYDPDAYGMSEYYSSRGKGADGMDATGPFSSKHQKKLHQVPLEPLRTHEGYQGTMALLLSLMRRGNFNSN